MAVKASKKAVVKEIAKKIQDSELIVFSTYNKLTVSADRELRRKLRKANAEYCVYKNSMTALAFKECNITIDEKILTGPTSFVFAKEPVAPAKALKEFAKENEALKIKGGVFQKQAVNAATINDLASLASREELLSKLVYLLQSPIVGFVRVVQGPILKLVYGLNAVSAKK